MRKSRRANAWTLLLAMSAFLSATAVAQVSRADAIAFEAQGNTAEAERAWRSIAEHDPQNVEAFARLGLLEARQEHYAEAIQDYLKAQAIRPDMPGLAMNLGLAYFKNAQFSDSLKIFDVELRAHPGDERLTLLAGMSHYGMGDYLVAIPYLQRAAAQEPSSLPLRLALAHSCLWSKQYDCVLVTYKEILTLDPSSAEAEMLAGEALDESGDDAGAMQHFRAAEAANSKEPNVHFCIAYLLWTQSHYAEAAKEFAAELANDPQHLQSRLYLGDSDLQLKLYSDAEAQLLEVEKTDAGSAMVHRDLGAIYANDGVTDKALAELQRAVELNPKDSEPHWHLARLYQATGRREEAQAEFAKVSTMKKEENEALADKLAQRRSPN